MAENILEWLEKNEENAASQRALAILGLEKTNNRLSNYCMRYLNKYRYTDFKMTCFLYNLIGKLEKIADELKYICLFLQQQDTIKQLQNKEVIKVFQDIIPFFKNTYETFYRADNKNIATIGLKRKELIKRALDLMSTLSQAEFRLMHHLINLTQIIFDMHPSIIAKAAQV